MPPMPSPPQILRQIAVVCGLGRRRPRTKGQAAAGASGADASGLGAEGEGEAETVPATGVTLKLKPPSTFGPESIKSAAWHVLREIGPEGLSVTVRDPWVSSIPCC